MADADVSVKSTSDASVIAVPEARSVWKLHKYRHTHGESEAGRPERESSACAQHANTKANGHMHAHTPGT